MTELFTDTKDELESTTDALNKVKEELESTKIYLNQTKEELKVTKIDRDEQKFLVEEHVKTEDVLYGEAEEVNIFIVFISLQLLNLTVSTHEDG